MTVTVPFAILATPSIQLLLMPAAALAGLMLGSFFNVVIWRLPRGESIVWPGSRCPSCNRPIRFYENIPLLSYVMLRGRCAGCEAPISPRYPLVELLTAALLVVLWKWFALPGVNAAAHWWQAVPVAIECAALLALIPLSFIDAGHYLIPDSITLPGLALGVLVSFIPGGRSPLDVALGIAAGGGLLLVIGLAADFIMKKESMGGGDIKLMAMIGSLFGWKMSLLTILYGSLLGTVVGLASIRWLPKDHRIPFGPFLAAGLWVALFSTKPLLRWYFSFF